MSRGRAVALFLIGLLFALMTVITTTTTTPTTTTTVTTTTTLTTTITTTVPTITTVITTTTTTPTTTTSKTEKSNTSSNADIVEASLGQAVVIMGDWRMTVEDVIETECVIDRGQYYCAPEGTKIILVKIKIENAGSRVRIPDLDFSLGRPVLVTNAHKSYEIEYPAYVLGVRADKAKESAVLYMKLDLGKYLAPGTYTEGHLMYLIPEGEKAEKLYLTCLIKPLLNKRITISISLVR